MTREFWCFSVCETQDAICVVVLYTSPFLLNSETASESLFANRRTFTRIRRHRTQKSEKNPISAGLDPRLLVLQHATFYLLGYADSKIKWIVIYWLKSFAKLTVSPNFWLNRRNSLGWFIKLRCWLGLKLTIPKI